MILSKNQISETFRRFMLRRGMPFSDIVLCSLASKASKMAVFLSSLVQLSYT
jgi:hypothetical protein